MEKREKYRQSVIKKLEQSGIDEDLALHAIIRRAIFSKQWGCSDFVKIGEAENVKFFNTLLFHESAHEYLNLGSTNEDEQSCYEFSRRVCERLGLAYHHELEQCSMEFIKIRNAYSDHQIFETNIENLPIRSRKILSLGYVQG